VRTLLTLAAVLPGLVAGLAVGLATRDRRRGINRAIALWGDLGCAAAGIALEVEGAEWLERARPAVFVFNHQSGVDPILVCKLLRRDFVGVAKREIRRNPLLGPAFAFAGTIFLDRSDPERAVEALRPGVERLRGGLSLAIAPEGTRSGGRDPGRFKKGGFRLAMHAKVPVVPIVLVNAADVLPRGAWIMQPARVRVVVHPPIATDDWTPETLGARLDALRELYRSTLEG
jgi:putative phosphoserine phosphatase/1-acylglycerol-3-phosphate O-acyltransferase